MTEWWIDVGLLDTVNASAIQETKGGEPVIALMKRAAVLLGVATLLGLGLSTPAAAGPATVSASAGDQVAAYRCGYSPSGIYAYYRHCTGDGSTVRIYVHHNGSPGSPDDYYTCVGPNQTKFIGYTYWVIGASYVNLC